MSITLTCNPKYKTYQANLSYLDLLEINDSYFLNFEEERTTFPLIKSRILNSDNFDLVTPINFQKSINNFTIELLENIYTEIKKTNAISFYIQTKNNINKSSSKYINIERVRTNYFFNLYLEEEAIFLNMKKDARQRLKKVIKDYNVELIEDTMSQDFYANYLRISKLNNFSDSYIFTLKQFEGFLKIERIKYIELRVKNQFFAGGFFGYNNDEVDYLYGANNKDFSDSTRLLIFKAVQYFKNKGFKKLFLGGGIQEGDTLANFKYRQGTFEQKCTTIRAIVNKEKAEELKKTQFNISWFDGFFPPYKSK